jgi:hypothetical protein
MNQNPFGKHTCIVDSTSCPIQLGGVRTWCHCFLDAAYPDCHNNGGPASKQMVKIFLQKIQVLLLI